MKEKEWETCESASSLMKNFCATTVYPHKKFGNLTKYFMDSTLNRDVLRQCLNFNKWIKTSLEKPDKQKISFSFV